MPKTKISEYSATANSNTDVASINIDEGCAPSGINNAIRAVMGHLKDFQAGTNSDAFNGPTNGAHNGSVGATTPAAGTFTTLTSTGNTVLGDASTDTLNVGNGGIVKDASGNVGIGTSSPGNKLSVVGDQRITLTTAGTSYPLILVNDTVSGVSAAAIAFQNGGATKASIQAAVYGNDYMTFNVGSNTERMRIDSSGNVLVTGAGGLGYGTGSGGTVTQATSKSTTVTLNKPTGKITMNNAALAGGSYVSFQLVNSLLGLNDVLVVSICWDGTIDPSNYSVSTGVYQPSAGNAYITLANRTGGSLSQAVQLNFAIIKCATS